MGGHRKHRNKIIGAGLVLGALTAAGGAQAATCAGMAGFKSKDTVVLSATEVTGRSFATPEKTPRTYSKLTPFCRVYASIRPTADSDIRVEIWLPLSGWNGKYYGAGSNGLGGNIHYPEIADALNRGYAVSATDTGHNNDAGDGVWALGHPEKIIDFGYRSTHLTAVLAKEVVAAFYGNKAKYSYFDGCSQGGQNAMMEAQRFPEDYDGIIAGDADYAAVHHEIGGHLFVPWLLYKDDVKFTLTAAKMTALGDAVLADCDKLDGVMDGVIENPLACRTDPSVVACPAGTSAANCLTPGEIDKIRALYEGPDKYMSAGYYGGYVRGNEGNTWRGFIAGGDAAGNQHGRVGFPFFKYFVYDDANWNFLNWDWRKDPALVANRNVGNQTMAQVLDADSADLGRLAARKGKLIQYHGWGDGNVSPTSAVNYYGRVQAFFRGKGQKADGTYRLFMVPGMGHCQGGPGPDRFDMLTALEQWVENGKAPDHIPAAHITEGKVDRTRILCPYPQVARYDGAGDKTAAASFRCAPAV